MKAFDKFVELCDKQSSKRTKHHHGDKTMKTRSELEMKTVAELKAAIVDGKIGDGITRMRIKARYFEAMDAMGFGFVQTADAWSDVVDVADLEVEAA